MTAPQYEPAPEAMLQRIRVLAPRKLHRLHRSMLGGQSLSLVSAEKVLAALEAAPDKEDTTPQAPPPEQWPGLGATRGDRPSPARASGPSFGELGAQVPKGSYAVPTSPGSDNDYGFWEITKGKDGGKWEGYTFVAQIIGGHEPEPVRGRVAYGALAKIVELGIDQASANYGRLMRHCGFCDIPLTKRDSRYNGRGAKCSENHGLPYVPAPAAWNDPGEES